MSRKFESALRPLPPEQPHSQLIDYVVAQVEAGAELIQIFDSWVGALNVQDYRYYIAST
jgi:uroporphyrinogen-III decarboxylase